MAYRVERSREEYLPAVCAFNARMEALGSGTGFLLPEQAPPPPAERPIRYDQMLLLDGGEVRGGYLSQIQEFRIAGRTVEAIGYQSPLSEGIIDKKFAPVGMALVKHALRSTPYIYTVGMGGIDTPLPRLLKGMGWYVRLAPFLFRVRHAAAFLRQIQLLRASRWRRYAAALLAFSGAGALGMAALQRRAWRAAARRVELDPIEEFGPWADALWDRLKDQHAVCAVRNAAVLNQLYPPGGGFYKVRAAVGAETVGWAVGMETAFRGHKYFGDLRVGAIVDTFAAPEYMEATARGAARVLEERDVDLTIGNQSDCRWVAAFRAAGFLSGPSNYGVTLSREVLRMVREAGRSEEHFHFTRGDGDGIVNLRT